MRTGALLVVLGTLTARSAWATPSARLVYVRSPEAASCPDEAALRGAVAARFGYDPFFAWARQTLVVQVWHAGQRYRSRVQMVDEQGMASGSRELVSDSDSCSTLFETTALAISIALDAAAKVEPPEPAPAPPAPPPPEPSPAPPQPDRPAPTVPEEPSPRAWRGFAGVAVLGSAAVAPSPSAGLSAFGGVRWRSASLALEARGDAPASMGVTGGHVTSWVYGAGFVPCGHYSLASLCAVGLLGRLQARSSGVTSPASESGLFAAAGGRAGIELPLSVAFELRAQLDVLANLAPKSFEVAGDGQVWSAPAVMVTAGAGVAVRFP